MRLRPHHALCIQKFTGHGYDDRFTEHMTEICETLQKFRDTQIDIIYGCDELCAVCPHNGRGKCATLEKVDAMDAAVLEAIGAHSGGTLPWRKLAGEARKNVLETDRFEKICGSCEWFDLCRSTSI